MTNTKEKMLCSKYNSDASNAVSFPNVPTELTPTNIPEQAAGNDIYMTGPSCVRSLRARNAGNTKRTQHVPNDGGDGASMWWTYLRRSHSEHTHGHYENRKMPVRSTFGYYAINLTLLANITHCGSAYLFALERLQKCSTLTSKIGGNCQQNCEHDVILIAK